MSFYKGSEGFSRVMNLFVNFLITLVFTTYMLVMAQAANPGAPIMEPLNFIVSFVPGYALAITLSTYIPVSNWANAAAARCKGKVTGTIANTLVWDFVLTTLLSFIMCFINNVIPMGFAGMMLNWLRFYPIALAMVFVLVLIVMPVGMALAAKVSGFDPRSPKAHPAEAGSQAA